MSVASDLRALLRDRLTAAVDQALTQALNRVLQELERALEDFAADSRGQQEPLKVYSAGFQFPEPQVKQEPQKESVFISDLWPPESPHVKQESTDRGRSPSAEKGEELNEIEISFVTSLNTVSGLNASQDPNPCSNDSSSLGLKESEKEETCSDLQQPDCSASCRSPEAEAPELLQIKQEPTGRGRPLSGAPEVEEFNVSQINSVTSLNTSTSPNAGQEPPLSSSPGPSLSPDPEEQGQRSEPQRDTVLESSPPPSLSPDPEEQEQCSEPQRDTVLGSSPPRSLSPDPEEQERSERQRDTVLGSSPPPSLSPDPEEQERSEPQRDTVLGSNPPPSLSPDPEEQEQCSEPQCDTVLESSPPSSPSALNSPNMFALKVPVIKLRNFLPKTASPNGKTLSKDKKTTPAKQGGGTRVKKVRYMCFCGELFTKEALERHLKSHDDKDRPPSGAPRPKIWKRSDSQAFNVKGCEQEAEKPEGSLGNGRSFQIGPSEVSPNKGSGERTEDFQNKTGQRKETQSCEGGNVRLRETFLRKPTGNPNEMGGVCEKNEAGAHVQEGAPLGAGAEGEPGAAFSCDVCGRGFSWLPLLYKHRKRHRGRFPFWCSNCGRTFRWSRDLRVHPCVQTGQRPYSCPLCQDAFFLRIQLHTHMKQHSAAQTKPEPNRTKSRLQRDPTRTKKD